MYVAYIITMGTTDSSKTMEDSAFNDCYLNQIWNEKDLH